MIPIADYVTVNETDTLVDVLQALESARQANARAHRDAIVLDDKGEFLGKVTMIDIFRALEPNYKKMMSKSGAGTLTKAFVMEAVKAFNLWIEAEADICRRGTRKTVADVMYTPRSVEFLQEDDTLEKALNLYVMGIHQPLIVKRGDRATGVLRFGDMFEVVRKALLACTTDK
jgi:CBS domain-containing protein